MFTLVKCIITTKNCCSTWPIMVGPDICGIMKKKATMPVPRNFIRWSGLFAIVGGILWTRFGIALGSLAVSLPGGPYRDSGSLLGWLNVSMLLIVIGSAGLHFQQKGHSGKLGMIGLGLSSVGAILWSVSSLIPSNYTDTAIMPLLVIPGILGITVGFLLAGIAFIQGKTLPPWVGGLLILASFVLLLFNDQYSTVWMIMPFGIIWTVLGGYSLFKELGKQTAAFKATVENDYQE